MAVKEFALGMLKLIIPCYSLITTQRRCRKQRADLRFDNQKKENLMLRYFLGFLRNSAMNDRMSPVRPVKLS